MLSSDDPVRVFQQFATLDLLSDGRAEIMAGRGSFIESFPLFGYDLADYDELFAEKLDLLLRLRDDERVTWAGRHRAPLDGVGGLPAPRPGACSPSGSRSAATPPRPRARARSASRWRSPSSAACPSGSHRSPRSTVEPRARHGHDAPALSINSHGFIADTSQEAADVSWPPFEAMMTKIGRERGWPPMGRDQFDASRSLRGANFVGSPQQVVEKILFQHEIFGHERFLLQLTVGSLDHAKTMRAIELFGTEVAPRVRAESSRALTRLSARRLPTGHRSTHRRASRFPTDVPANTRVSYGTSVTDVVERYLTLGLRLGRHADGLVDAYYGPAELAVRRSRRKAARACRARRRGGGARGRGRAAPSSTPSEPGWLTDQIRGIRVYAGMLAGEARSYADEVEACYGVRPEPGSEAAYREAHEQLDELLPGSGALGARYERWRSDHAVLPERMVPALSALIEVLHRRTQRLLDLPDGEQLVVEEVHDEPWWAFNYYLGALRSRVVINVDVPTTAGDLVTLAGHEAYPGHHTEHAVKEQRLIRDRGFDRGGDPARADTTGCRERGHCGSRARAPPRRRLEQELGDVLAASGLDADLDRALAIDRARRPLRGIALDAALMIHEHGASTDDAQAHVERWGLATPDGQPTRCDS